LEIRQSLNENKPLAVTITALMVVSAVVFILWYTRSSQSNSFATREFFSDDDGTTWFVDDGTKLVPFDHNGKQAVLAKVFQSKDGQMFVGYLEKLSDDVKQRVEATRAQEPGHSGMTKADPTGFNGMMLKKPHAGDWVKSNDPAARDITKVTCPDGSSDCVPVPP
jgi:hypothetical protein